MYELKAMQIENIKTHWTWNEYIHEKYEQFILLLYTCTTAWKIISEPLARTHKLSSVNTDLVCPTPELF